MKPQATICIVWASFAWLSALLMLRKRLWDSVTIKLLDQQQQFTYIPGLHEAILDGEELTWLQFDLATHYPEYVQARVDDIQSHQLTTSEWIVHEFDYCVVATGSRTRPHHDSADIHSYTVSAPQHIAPLNDKLSDPNTHTITIIGGGYTGIEIASIIAQRQRADQTVQIIHSRDRLFDRLSEYISLTCQRWLTKLDVHITLNARVDQIQSDHIILQDGRRIQSDCTIIARGIRVNDESFEPNLSFDMSYQAVDADHIYLCGDVAQHGLIATAHNAMFEGRRVGDLIADQIQWVSRDYPPLTNWDKLAIALWSRDGIITNWTKGIYIPWLVWLAKKIIQYRVLIEFKYKIMLPV